LEHNSVGIENLVGIVYALKKSGFFRSQIKLVSGVISKNVRRPERQTEAKQLRGKKIKIDVQTVRR